MQSYVDEVRELNEQEERDRILEAEREKRKELEERREKVRKAREDAAIARGKMQIVFKSGASILQAVLTLQEKIFFSGKV